ncbi:MAG: response regulator [Thermodesulfobacteriota bacterium]
MHKPIKVLIVDDEQQFRATTKKILDMRGFEALVAESGKQAITLMDKKPDVVILDIKMPEMDGLTALSRIKEISPGTPVIMLTGHGGEPSAKKAREGDAFDYLAKPCSIDLLSAKIQEAWRFTHSEEAKRERDVSDVMIPLSAYSTLPETASVRQAVALLRDTWLQRTATDRIVDSGHVSIMVLSPGRDVVGVIAIVDLMAALLPPYLSAPKPSLADSIQYSPMFWDGVFTMRAKEIGDLTLGEIMGPPPLTIDGDSNLMEAVYRMHKNLVRRLGVTENGKIVGIIREQDILFELGVILK